MSNVVPPSSAPFGGTFPKGEGIASLKNNFAYYTTKSKGNAISI